MAADDDAASSYVDYDAFLAPTFSATAFANRVVLAANDPADAPIDLATPLSRVLFDVQEVDTRLHALTTADALPLLRHAGLQSAAAAAVLDGVAAHVAALAASYARLERDVGARHAEAERVRRAAARLWVTLRIGRAAGRALLLGRQLDAQLADVAPAAAPSGGGGAATAKTDDPSALVRAAHTLLALRALFAASGPGEEGEHLARLAVLQTLRADLLAPAEQRLRQRAQQAVREFALAPPAAATDAAAAAGRGTPPTSPPAPTAGGTPFAQTAATRTRTAAAAQALYLLSYAAAPPSTAAGAALPPPALLLGALQAYLQAALSSSLAGVSRALAALATLPRALAEAAARCRSVVALEGLLAATRAPAHAALPPLPPPAPPSASPGGGPPRPAHVPADSLLAPALAALETASLASHFWRSLASGLSLRAREVVGRGGAAARALRAGREGVRESIRDAVLRGCEGAAGEGGWEREVGVMVGSVVGVLGR